MTQIKLRRDTAANFTSKNPVLGIGEPAYETDTKKLKIGDGSTAYTQLTYFSSGGGSSDITATLPIKIVNDVISLEVDGQTIQVVDGKLHANLDELGNEVNSLAGDVTALQADVLKKQDKLTAGDNITISADNVISSTGGSIPSNMATTNTAQDITGAKSLTAGLTTFKNRDSIRKVVGEINSNGYYCNYYTSRDSGEKPCYLGKLAENAFNMGIPDLKGVEGRIFAKTLTKWNGNIEIGTILSTDNLGSYVDGTTITFNNNKLTASGGGGSAPTNMVTTDTEQTITGTKTFEGNLTFKGNTNWRGVYNNNSRLSLVDTLDGSASISICNSNGNTAMYGVGGGSSYVTYFQPAYGSTKLILNNYQDGSSENGIAPIVEITGNLQNRINSTNYQILTQNNVTAGDNIMITNTSTGIQISSASARGGVTPKAYITETYVNGKSGYILYSNGYCEQWDDNTGTSLTSITFLKPYKDTNYTVLANSGYPNDNSVYNCFLPHEKTTTGFSVKWTDPVRFNMWRAFGYVQI